jgi:hypothetical protein
LRQRWRQSSGSCVAVAATYGPYRCPRCYMLQKWVTSLQSCKVTSGAGVDGSCVAVAVTYGPYECPRCYMLHATKWLFPGNPTVLATRLARPRCYMLQKWGKAEILKAENSNRRDDKVCDKGGDEVPEAAWLWRSRTAHKRLNVSSSCSCSSSGLLLWRGERPPDRARERARGRGQWSLAFLRHALRKVSYLQVRLVVGDYSGRF